MFLDASAVVAVMAREPGFEAVVRQLEESQSQRLYSPIVRFETVLALARAMSVRSGRHKTIAESFAAAGAAFDSFVKRVNAREIPISPEIGQTAIAACSTYGKIIGHAARLNLGDCFAYGCAKESGVGLLYKGDDFAKTDLA